MGGGKGIWGEVGVEYGEKEGRKEGKEGRKEERKEGNKEGKMNPRTTELIHNRITRSIDKSDILQYLEDLAANHIIHQIFYNLGFTLPSPPPHPIYRLINIYIL